MSVGNKEKMSYTLCPLEGDNVRRALEVLFESSIHYQDRSLSKSIKLGIDL